MKFFMLIFAAGLYPDHFLWKVIPVGEHKGEGARYTKKEEVETSDEVLQRVRCMLRDILAVWKLYCNREFDLWVNNFVCGHIYLARQRWQAFDTLQTQWFNENHCLKAIPEFLCAFVFWLVCLKACKTAASTTDNFSTSTGDTFHAASHSLDNSSATMGGYLESLLPSSGTSGTKQSQEEPDEWKQVAYINLIVMLLMFSYCCVPISIILLL